MKKLLSLILSVFVIFASCQKSNTEKNKTNGISTIEQEQAVEVADEQPEPVAEVTARVRTTNWRYNRYTSTA